MGNSMYRQSPSTATLSFAPIEMDFDLKVIVGKFPTSRRSSLFTWASRFGSRVSNEAASMFASIRD